MKFSKQRLKRVRPLFGTYVEITLEGRTTSSQLSDWITAAFESLSALDHLLSIHRPTSDLSRLNQYPAGTWVTVHPHTRRVLRAANQLWEESRGIFDIRCGSQGMPATKQEEPPTHLRGTWARRNGAGWLDLGGIAKGYAVDCVVRDLKRWSRGVALDGVVNAGGDLRRFGRSKPALAVATSTVRTPVNQRWLSPAVHVDRTRSRPRFNAPTVSVVARECLWADALTKVAMLAPAAIARHCLQSHDANAMTFSSQGHWKEMA